MPTLLSLTRMKLRIFCLQDPLTSSILASFDEAFQINGRAEERWSLMDQQPWDPFPLLTKWREARRHSLFI